jgi:hypothetical protein
MMDTEDSDRILITKITKGKISTPVERICGRLFFSATCAFIANIRALSGCFRLKNGGVKGNIERENLAAGLFAWVALPH